MDVYVYIYPSIYLYYKQVEIARPGACLRPKPSGLRIHGPRPPAASPT